METNSRPEMAVLRIAGALLASAQGDHIEQPDTDPALRLTRSLEPGHVLTIEPGVYFIDSLLEPLRQSGQAEQINWSAVGELRRFGGIRIEDNVRVLDDGCENLTRDAFDA